MDTLVILQGPTTGRRFTLKGERWVLGRQADSHICLESQAVSRHHAQISRQDAAYFIEDLGSSNGTYVNGRRINGRTPLSDKDQLEIGPYLFGLRLETRVEEPGANQIIREEISANSSNLSLFSRDPAQKLQVVLDIAHHLARTLDMETLLGKLLDELLRLFPFADRGMVLLQEGDHLRIRAQRSRRAEETMLASYSRTIVQRALAEGVGILSEDVRLDERFQASMTLPVLNLRSVLCVPLIGSDNRRLGAIQLDNSRPGKQFKLEDLQLLTALGLQVGVVLENAALHAELVREERFRQELALAQEIQQGFLPTEFPPAGDSGYELFARVVPARKVSGDLYDFHVLNDQRLAFAVGDVSGKGMPAALFMVAVRTLCRLFAAAGEGPAATLTRLNAAIAADNPSMMFVTVVYGVYEPAAGAVTFSSGGHPRPLLRRADGQVEEVVIKPGMLLGCEGVNLGLTEVSLTLAPGETLILYTDGFTEARAPDGKVFLGLERFQEMLGGERTKLPLKDCANYLRGAVEKFMGTTELQDDLTLLFLRRL